MTSQDKIARRKLSLLELAQDLNNVSKACKVMGYSRQQFYEIRRNFQTYGSQGLIDRLLGAKGPHPNRVSEVIDTFLVGTLKGVGKVYLQSIVDCHSRYAWGRLFTSKLTITAVYTMNNDVLPTFEAHKAKIDVVLSDNGREFCGRPDKHPYELFLQLEEIEHRTTKVKRPQSNGIVERLHRTLLDEHFRVEGRRCWYETVEEMQEELDKFLLYYNTKRPHQGRNMNGRTPQKAFVQGLPKPSKTLNQRPTERTRKQTSNKLPNHRIKAANVRSLPSQYTQYIHKTWNPNGYQSVKQL